MVFAYLSTALHMIVSRYLLLWMMVSNVLLVYLCSCSFIMIFCFVWCVLCLTFSPYCDCHVCSVELTHLTSVFGNVGFQDKKWKNCVHSPVEQTFSEVSAITYFSCNGYLIIAWVGSMFTCTQIHTNSIIKLLFLFLFKVVYAFGGSSFFELYFTFLCLVLLDVFLMFLWFQPWWIFWLIIRPRPSASLLS